EAGLYLPPETAQEPDVRDEVLVPLALGHRSHDEAAERRRQVSHDGAQAVALGVVVDPAGDADVPSLRHVHDVPPRDGYKGGDAGPPCAQRLPWGLPHGPPC